MEPGTSRRAFVDRPVADVPGALAAARHAAALWELQDPVLERAGMNVICDAGDVVVRVSDPNGSAQAPIRLAMFWADRGIRVARPARPEAVTSDGFSVSAWERVVPAQGAPVDWQAVGRAIRMVHETDPSGLPSGVPLPMPTALPWWRLHALLDEHLSDLDDAAARGIRAVIDRHAAWPTYTDRVVCHGDVHPGNVVMAVDGPVLLDWDLLSWAPAGWDHAPMMTWASRWGGRAGEYEEFADGYGRSFRDDPAATAFAELRLVAATLMRLGAARRDPRARSEAELRLRYWRGDPDAPPWTAQ